MSRRSLPPGVIDRNGRAMLDKRDRRVPGGRIARALECSSSDTSTVHERWHAITTLLDRGELVAVQRWLDSEVHITELVAAVREGKVEQLRTISSGRTLGQQLTAFLDEISGTRAGGTFKAYHAYGKSMVKALGADTPMDQIGLADIRSWLFGPQPTIGKPWAATTVGHARTFGGQLWNWVITADAVEAQRLGGVPRLTVNPFKAIKLPAAMSTQSKVSFLPHSDWAETLDKWRGTPYAAFMGCAFLAGLRIGEIVHLRRERDVRLDVSQIVIQGRDGWQPKTKRSWRTVPVGPTLASLIREHISMGFAGPDYLFRAPTRPDGPVGGTKANNWAKEAYGLAGIPYGRFKDDGLTLHSGRHSYATWHAQNRVPVDVIASLIGDTVEVVVKTYLHHQQRDRIEAVRDLENLVGDPHADRGMMVV